MLILMVTSPVQQEESIHAEQLRSPHFEQRLDPFGNQHSHLPQHFQEAQKSSGRVWWSGFSYGKSDREYVRWVERMGCGRCLSRSEAPSTLSDTSLISQNHAGTVHLFA